MPKFKLSTADFYLLQRVIDKKIGNSPQIRSKVFWAGVVAWIPFGIGCVLLVRFFQINQDLNAALSQIVSSFSLWMILFFAVNVFRQSLFRKFWIHTDGWFAREQQVGFSEIGFEIKSELSQAFFSWLVVTEYYVDSVNHYLFIDSSQAVIIPKSIVDQTDGATAQLNLGLNHLAYKNKHQ